MDLKTDQFNSIQTNVSNSIPVQNTIRPLTTLDYQSSFVSGISWGIVVLLIVLLLSWFVSIMRYRRNP